MKTKTVFFIFAALFICLPAFGANTGTSSGIALETGIEKWVDLIIYISKSALIISLVAAALSWMFGMMGKGFIIVCGSVAASGIIYGGSTFFDYLGTNPALF